MSSCLYCGENTTNDDFCCHCCGRPVSFDLPKPVSESPKGFY
ncbi:MAG TPA: hypothetical protein VI790_03760 [Candidatus Nanoarchaeia archaeon]|nr:hypothetical protein [Candidatus Nanoarchaeia archaeon]